MLSIEEQNELRRREEEERRRRDELARQRTMALAMRQQERQRQQGSGPSPAMAAQFMGGGGSSGGSGTGSALAAAGPWAALAAAIIANESYQRNTGNRPDDFGDQVVEGLTGESLERDLTRYLGDDGFGEVAGKLAHPEGVLDLMKEPEKLLKFWEWF